MSSAETDPESRPDAPPVPGAATAPDSAEISVAADPAAAEPPVPKGIPDATVARLPGYLRVLDALAEGAGPDEVGGAGHVSSGTLAEAAGVSPAQLRKDLSHLGSYGTRGVGYDVAFLRFQIRRTVGSARDWPVVIVGLGNLGTALANYSGFYSRGFHVVGLVDPSPALVGRLIHGLAITDLTDLESLVERTGAVIGVIATPADAAQEVADRLVQVGVTSILNFAPAVLTVPDGVNARKVDLGQELQILAYHEHRRGDGGSGTRHPEGPGGGMIVERQAERARVPAPARQLVHSDGEDR